MGLSVEAITSRYWAIAESRAVFISAATLPRALPLPEVWSDKSFSQRLHEKRASPISAAAVG